MLVTLLHGVLIALSCQEEVASWLVLNDLVLTAPHALPGTFRAAWLSTGLVADTLWGWGWLVSWPEGLILGSQPSPRPG